MGKLRLVYPFKTLFLRLISMETNYPSAVKMRCSQRRKDEK